MGFGFVSAQFDDAASAAAYAASHAGDGAAARFFRNRIPLVERFLRAAPGGTLLDVGCGPGMMVRSVLTARPGDFRVSALDRSQAMVEACVRNTDDAGLGPGPAAHEHGMDTYQSPPWLAQARQHRLPARRP